MTDCNNPETPLRKKAGWPDLASLGIPLGPYDVVQLGRFLYYSMPSHIKTPANYSIALLMGIMVCSCGGCDFQVRTSVMLQCRDWDIISAGAETVPMCAPVRGSPKQIHR